MSAINPSFMSLDDIAPLARSGRPVRWEHWTRETEGKIWPWKAVTSHSTSTDKFSLVDHGLLDGMEVELSAASALPTLKWGASLEFSGPKFYVTAASDDDFKLCAFPGEAALDITAAGTGALFIRRAKARLWLLFARTEWWLIGADATPRLCHANDLTAEEMQGARWTWLDEDCLAERQVDQLVRPSEEWGVECSSPIGTLAADTVTSDVDFSEAEVDPDGGTADTTPASGLLGGSDGGDGESSGSGSGNSSSSGGLLGGGGSSGGSGSGGDNPLGGVVGGGGGSGTPGGGPPAEPAPDDDFEVDATLTATVEILEGYQPQELMLATWQGAWFTWRAVLTATGKYDGEAFSVRITTAGPNTGPARLIWSGYLRTEQKIDGAYNIQLPNPTGGDAYLSLQMTAKKSAATLAGDTSNSVHFYNNH